MDKIRISVLLIGFLCAKEISAGGDGGNANYRLYNRLLRQYNPDIRPVDDPATPIKVSFGLALMEVLKTEETPGQITVRAWMRMSWKDDFLHWNPKTYAGVNQVYLPAKDVWTPDIELFNGVKSDVRKDMHVVVQSNGNVIYVTPGRFLITCKHEFRGNSWTCPFQFGSWVYDGNKIDLWPYDGQENVDLSNLTPSDHWTVLEATGKRVEKKYDCCVEPYVSMEYKLKLRSKIGPSLMGRK